MPDALARVFVCSTALLSLLAVPGCADKLAGIDVITAEQIDRSSSASLDWSAGPRPTAGSIVIGAGANIHAPVVLASDPDRTVGALVAAQPWVATPTATPTPTVAPASLDVPLPERDDAADLIPDPWPTIAPIPTLAPIVYEVPE